MHLIINQGIINENYHDVVIRLYSPAFFSLCSNRDGNRRYGADGRKKFASRLTGIIKSPKPAWEIKYISQQKKSCRNK